MGLVGIGDQRAGLHQHDASMAGPLAGRARSRGAIAPRPGATQASTGTTIPTNDTMAATVPAVIPADQPRWRRPGRRAATRAARPPVPRHQPGGWHLNKHQRVPPPPPSWMVAAQGCHGGPPVGGASAFGARAGKRHQRGRPAPELGRRPDHGYPRDRAGEPAGCCACAPVAVSGRTRCCMQAPGLTDVSWPLCPASIAVSTGGDA